MAGPLGSPPPGSDEPRNSPVELRAALRIASAKCERAVAQRDFYQQSLEKLRAEHEETQGELAALRIAASATTYVQDRKSMDLTAGRSKPRSMLARISWRTIALLIGAGLLATLIGLWLAVTHRPGWYHPVAIDRARLHADKAALVGLQDEISAALNSGRAIRFRLDEAQINRWLAARTEMWPEATLDLGTLQDPQVSLRDGEIRLGATASRGSLRAVVALVCRVDVQEDRVTVSYGGPRLGVLPLPERWISDFVSHFPGDGRGAIQADGAGTITGENDWVWPNGRRRCRLRELHISDGVAEGVLEPLAIGRG